MTSTTQACLICGKPYQARGSGQHQRYCSNACKSKAAAQRTARRRSAEAVQCPVCGKEFYPGMWKGNTQRFCTSACSQIARRGQPNRRSLEGYKQEGAVKFIHSPDPDGWPTGCTFPKSEVVETLRLGYFPAGSRFRFQHRIYTVCGKEAVSNDGERMG